jgi:hypothetical protein
MPDVGIAQPPFLWIPQAPSPRTEQSVSEAVLHTVKCTFSYTATPLHDFKCMVLNYVQGKLYLSPPLHKQFRAERPSAEKVPRVGYIDE